MNLLQCPFCGKEIEDDSFYCDQCGEELKICPSGHGFKQGKRCNKCGTELVEAKSAADNQAPPVVTPPTTTSQPQSTEKRPQITDTVQTPPAEVENVPPQQSDAPEKTIRPTAAPVEPKYLVSNAVNARLELKNGAIIGRRAGDYTNVFGNQGYVSGTHARLQKNVSGVWEIVDLDSS
ncbi:MAG: zinc ribbon domain-containing protein, partial [Prolixibacteraceae bacterium]|nr:zinc ribbon domain-containing protein [Prolixibacteraceae bacterium]